MGAKRWIRVLLLRDELELIKINQEGNAVNKNERECVWVKEKVGKEI